MDRLLLRASFPVHRKQQFLWTGFLSRPSFFLDSFFHTEAIEEAKERKKEKGKIFDLLQISGLLSKLPGWIISFNMIGVGINLNFAEFIRACKMNIITWQYFKRFIYIYIYIKRESTMARISIPA